MRNPFSKSTITTALRVKRLLWNVVYVVCYRPTPNVLFGWRRTCLRAFGATIGKGVHLYPTARIWAPWLLSMGDDACLGPDVDCYNVARVSILAGAIVSQGAFICTASHDYRDSEFPLIVAPVTIAEGSWICSRAFIGPGVNVGAEAVVAACAVVTKSVLPGSVVGGNPAIVIGRNGRVSKYRRKDSSNGAEVFI
jgi:putative colanic acid biosynthesis acetyltransferase WcaF